MLTKVVNNSHKRGFWDGLDLELLIQGFSYETPRISLDGKKVAYIQSLEKGSFLFIYDIESQSHQQLISRNSLSTGTPYGGGTYCWSHDSKFIYFTSKGKLHRIDADGGLEEPLNSLGNSFSLFASADWLLFSVEHDDHMSLGRLKLDENIHRNWPTRLPIEDNFFYDATINSETGSISVHSWSFPNMSWNGSKIEILSFDFPDSSKLTRTIIAGSATIATSQAKFSPDGSKVSFLHEETGWLNLWTANADGSDPAILVDEKYEHAYSTWVTGASNHVWIDNDQIIFTRNDQGFLSLVHVNTKTKETTLINLPTGYYSALSVSDNGERLVCHYNNYHTKGEIWLIETSTILSESPRLSVVCKSGIKLSKLIKSEFIIPKRIEFTTRDGSSCYGLLYAKKDINGQVTKAPVIISVHGGPTGMRTNNWDNGPQYFASRGYVVFQVNHRGSIGFGRDYREILNENWGIYDVQDSIDGLNYLHEQGIVNKEKSIIMGGSAGGYTVLMTLATEQKVFTAGVDLFGVSDNFLLAEDTHYLESRYTDTLVGPLPEAAANYIKRSPIFIADQIVDPLLILQGEDDPVVPKNQSEKIKEKVKGPVEYKLYKGEEHGFSKLSSLRDMYPRIEKFIRKYVLYR